MGKKQLIDLLISFLRKKLFPDFSNKVTWMVVSIGAGILVTPLPLRLVVANWLIRAFNINSGSPITLPELAPVVVDKWIGFGLIVLALAHNLAYRWLRYLNAESERKVAEQRRQADINLFDQFLKVLGSRSRSMVLLKNFDFGGSFEPGELDGLDTFVVEWDCAEKKFISEELEANRLELWNKCRDFGFLLAGKSGPIANGRLCVVSERFLGAEIPDWVRDNIKDINLAATETHEMHQHFIKSAKRVLKC